MKASTRWPRRLVRSASRALEEADIATGRANIRTLGKLVARESPLNATTALSREYFRAMIPTGDGLPLVGSGKRMLGVLPSETTAADGAFGPGTGGMSVSPDSLWHVPHHRRPRRMGRGSTGAAQDWIFAVDQDSLNAASLATRFDPNNPTMHAFIEPVRVLALAAYTAALTAT